MCASVICLVTQKTVQRATDNTTLQNHVFPFNLQLIFSQRKLFVLNVNLYFIAVFKFNVATACALRCCKLLCNITVCALIVVYVLCV
jgi:hypothetical protein